MRTPTIARLATVTLLLSFAIYAARNPASARNSTTPVAEWTLGTPTIRIGGSSATGGVELTEIMSATPVGEDSLLVVDSKITALLLFDARGTLARRISREGQGPGEFSRVAFAGLIGDSVWGADTRASRVLFFSKSGQYLSSRPLPRASVRTAPRTTSSYTARGILTNGRMPGYIAVPSAPPQRGSAPAHGTVGILGLFQSDSVVRDTLAWMPQASTPLYLDVPPWLHFPGPNHFADTPLWRVASTGSAVIAVDRTIPRDSASARYRVRKWDGNGKLSFSVDIRFVPKRVPPAQLDSVIDVLTNDLADNYPSRAVARKLVSDTVGKPAFFPPVSDIVVGTDGFIWLAREGFVMPPLSMRRYDVLDSLGRLAGTIGLRRPGRIVATTKSAVWVVETDADDVPTIVRYPVQRM